MLYFSDFVLTPFAYHVKLNTTDRQNSSQIQLEYRRNSTIVGAQTFFASLHFGGLFFQAIQTLQCIYTCLNHMSNMAGVL